MALTKVTLIQDGVITADHLHANHGITTDNIGEGTNKFYTDARVAQYLSANNYQTAAAGYITGITHDLDNKTLTFTKSNSTSETVNLMQYIDDTNLARLTSGTVDAATGIATFTRDDLTTFTVDFSSLLDDTNDYVNSASFNALNGVLTLNRLGGGTVTVDLDGRYLTSETDSQTLSWADATNTLSISNGNSVVITGFADASHSHTFASLTSKPTTIAGYGITDAITTGNIGSQSVSYASNAGTLDNIDSSQFLRSDTADTATGVVTFQTTGAPFQKWQNTNAGNYLLLGMYDDTGAQRVWFGLGGRTQTFGSYAAYSQDGLSMNLDGAGAINISNRGTSKTINLNTGSESGSNFTTLRMINQSVYVTPDSHTGDIHSPRYYDINNTGFYADMAGVTNLKHLRIIGNWADYGAPYDGQITIRGNYPSIQFRSVNADKMWLRHMDGAGEIQHYFATGVDSTAWSIKHTMYQTGSFRSVGDHRAPVFYDLDDTNYYANPNGTNQLYQLKVPGKTDGWSISTGPHDTSRVTNDNARSAVVINSDYYPHFYMNALYASNVNHGAVFSMTGAKSAGGYTRFSMGIPNQDPSMMSMGFYSDQANPHYGCGGDTLGEDTWGSVLWLSSAGHLQTKGSMRSPIFYDSNNTGYYVDPMSTSNMNDVQINGTVRFMNYGLGVTGTYTSTRLQTIFNMDDQYSISADGSLTNNAYGLYWSHPNAGGLGGANNLASHGIIILEAGGYKGSWGGGRLVTTADIRGTIFYDYNNTGYYVDPASTSVFSYIQGNTKFMNYGNGYKSYNLYGMVGDYDQNSTAEKIIWTIGDSWNSIGNMYGLGYSFGAGYDHHLSIKNNGTTYHRISFASQGAYFTGTVTASSDHRAPIFYDTNNTGYYLDPASLSALKSIITDSVQLGGSGSAIKEFSSGGNTGLQFQSNASGYYRFGSQYGNDYGYEFSIGDGNYKQLIDRLSYSEVFSSFMSGGGPTGGLPAFAFGNSSIVVTTSDFTTSINTSNNFVWGNMNVSGTFYAATKYFRIDHPLKPETHDLVHSVVESSRADVYYRGKSKLVNGSAIINIDEYVGMTEGTFEALTKDVQCFTTNEDSWTNVKGNVVGNLLTIIAQDETCEDNVSWLVFGERNDDVYINRDDTDENGRLILEPEAIGTMDERREAFALKSKRNELTEEQMRDIVNSRLSEMGL
jgi:hypothetical protein